MDWSLLGFDQDELAKVGHDRPVLRRLEKLLTG